MSPVALHEVTKYSLVRFLFSPLLSHAHSLSLSISPQGALSLGIGTQKKPDTAVWALFFPQHRWKEKKTKKKRSSPCSHQAPCPTPPPCLKKPVFLLIPEPMTTIIVWALCAHPYLLPITNNSNKSHNQRLRRREASLGTQVGRISSNFSFN